jgi:putative endonuclease
VTDPRRTLGDGGEDRAAAWYLDHGYEVVARNWRTRSGEIDLVARRAGELVVCEVKTRASDRFGSGAEAVTFTKQQRLRKLALEFMRESGEPAKAIRFDVVSITAGEMTVIENAF